jgi:hypothetical protein
MHVQRLVSVVKMATMLEENTTEEQCSVVLFLSVKELSAKDIHKSNVSCLWWEVSVV